MREDYAKKRGLGLAQGAAHSGKMPASRATSGVTQEYVPDRDGGAYDEPSPWKGGDAGFENMNDDYRRDPAYDGARRSHQDDVEQSNAYNDGGEDSVKGAPLWDEAQEDKAANGYTPEFKAKWYKRCKDAGMSDEGARDFVDSLASDEE